MPNKNTKPKITSKDKVEKVKIPFLWKHLSMTRQDIVTFWPSMLGVIFVYALVYAVTVIGLNFVIPSFNDSTNSTGVLASEQNVDSLTKAVDSISNSLTFISGDQSSTLVQFILFLVASLAFMWVLRKIRKLQKVKISEAYYQGTAQFIAMFLLIIWFVLFLIPVSIGTTILSVGLSASTTALEISIISIISVLLFALTVWLYARYWPSFYIISLPGMRPINALKNASSLTKKYRLNITIQVFGFVMITLFLVILAILPLAFILPVVVPYWVYTLMFIIFATTHTFLFSIYRSLVGEK